MNNQEYRARTRQALAEALTTFHRSIVATRALAVRLDTWLARRQRAAQASQDLANMSDRELVDIGISRASVDPIVRGEWQRDCMT